jgi:hypothetical protein
MDTEALKKARDEVTALEAKMLEEVRVKAALLGISLDGTPAPMQKRKRRTKAEIEADNAGGDK